MTIFSTPLQASQTKVLNLWNGSTNVTPPTNWFATSFNDSAWATATIATTQFTGQPFGSVGSSFGNTSNTRISLAWDNCHSDPIAPWSTPPNGREEFLFRWSFTLPSVADVNWMCVNITSGAGTGSGWSSGLAYINGGGAFTFNSTNWGGNMFRFLPGQTNLLAFWVNSGNTGNAVTWGSYGWVAVGLSDGRTAVAAVNNWAAVIGD